MGRVLDLLGKLVYQEGDFVFFVCPLEARRRAKPSKEVEEWTRPEDLSSADLRKVLPRRLVNVMYHRMRRGQARLYCLRSDEGEIAAWAWTQDWAPFRRKFSAVSGDNSVLLGPALTYFEHRGRGLHGKLVSHRVAVAPLSKSIQTITSPDNIASQKGLVKVGFVWTRRLRVRFFFRLFALTTEVPWSPPEALSAVLERAEAASEPP